jgi:hypothetical protein
MGCQRAAVASVRPRTARPAARGKGVQDCTAEVLAAVAAERQKREETKLAEAEQAIIQGDREPWTPDLLHLIAGMGVDVAALVERYRERTAGRGIDDPNAYLLAMAKDAVAKRVGTTREVVAAIANTVVDDDSADVMVTHRGRTGHRPSA